MEVFVGNLAAIAEQLFLRVKKVYLKTLATFNITSSHLFSKLNVLLLSLGSNFVVLSHVKLSLIWKDEYQLQNIFTSDLLGFSSPHFFSYSFLPCHSQKLSHHVLSSNAFLRCMLICKSTTIKCYDRMLYLEVSNYLMFKTNHIPFRT